MFHSELLNFHIDYCQLCCDVPQTSIHSLSCYTLLCGLLIETLEKLYVHICLNCKMKRIISINRWLLDNLSHF